MKHHSSMTDIIEMWYHALGFDSKFDAEFYEALSSISISEDTRIDTYPLDTMEGKENLLAFLYMCQQTQQEYETRGISHEILIDTLSDIVVWCNTWSEIKGELFLGSTGWLSNHMRLNLFKIGRLQYCIEPMNEAVKSFGLGGDHYIGVHIPATGPLHTDLCRSSLKEARAFFENHFPNINYTHFSCNSWLLDASLREFLPADSNILKFAELFTPVDTQKSDDIIHYVFGKQITRQTLADVPCKTDFAAKIKDAILNGRDFYTTRGLIAK